jgi:hypothetical protein
VSAPDEFYDDEFYDDDDDQKTTRRLFLSTKHERTDGL